ncbi:hypothetical protein AB0I28_10240 [Phytomonospora sp. NPDC050363]|uniref:helix-turn-helix domain-containing protein n=1 Tax=Phytomonospora sp. NPDC050363 TaxID=3155642 RepID=UPI0033C5CC99
MINYGGYENVTDFDRVRLGMVLAGHYRAGATVRELAEQRGLSAGLTRTLLIETGTELRPLDRDLTVSRPAA